MALFIVVLLVPSLFITESALLLSLLFGANSLYSLCVARVKSIEELAVCSLLAALCFAPWLPLAISLASLSHVLVSLVSASLVFDLTVWLCGLPKLSHW